MADKSRIMIMQFSVSHQIITRVDDNDIVADSRNYLYAEFDFQTSEWEGIEKTCIFQSGNERWRQLLENDQCLVPWEWLVGGGTKYVSVFGGDLITANRSVIKVGKSGYGDGQISKPPTPDIYDQIIEKLDRKADGISIEGNVVRLFSGEKMIYEKSFDIDGGTFDDWKE